VHCTLHALLYDQLAAGARRSRKCVGGETVIGREGTVRARLKLLTLITNRTGPNYSVENFCGSLPVVLAVVFSHNLTS